MTVNEKINKAKESHREEMERFDEDTRKFVYENGSKFSTCDYILHRRSMNTYHRGAWNALYKLQQEIKLV